MGAYENALREEGSREDLIRVLEEAWDERDQLKAGSPLNKMHAMVERFNRQIIGLEPPDRPTLLNSERRTFRTLHLLEEFCEFLTALDDEDLEGTVDGLLDLIYVAHGTLFEMGIPSGAAFEEVHEANMRRERGESGRKNSGGFDAVKPEGWKPPDLTPYITVKRDQLIAALNTAPVDVAFTRRSLPDNASRPKLLVIGHGRHGKDTVCEMLRDSYGFTFTSSSMFCAEHVMFPLLSKKYGYRSVNDCFADRHNHRGKWYDAIRDFNRPDASALTKAILQENDVYCGMRSDEELEASRGLFDAIIWVDRSDHVEPEDEASCTVTRDMATHVLDNNGTRDDLVLNLHELLGEIL